MVARFWKGKGKLGADQLSEKREKMLMELCSIQEESPRATEWAQAQPVVSHVATKT